MMKWFTVKNRFSIVCRATYGRNSRICAFIMVGCGYFRVRNYCLWVTNLFRVASGIMTLVSIGICWKAAIIGITVFSVWCAI